MVIFLGDVDQTAEDMASAAAALVMNGHDSLLQHLITNRHNFLRVCADPAR